MWLVPNVTKNEFLVDKQIFCDKMVEIESDISREARFLANKIQRSSHITKNTDYMPALRLHYLAEINQNEEHMAIANADLKRLGFGSTG